jgi:hypothetical protein
MRKLLFLFLLAALPAWAQQSASGSITASSSGCSSSTTCVLLTLPNQDFGGATITLSGTFSATLQFEGSADGTNYNALGAAPLAGGTVVTSATGTGTWQASIVGLNYVRVRCSAFVSGTVTVTIQASKAATTLGGSVSGTTGSGASPVMGFYFTNACPVANTGQCFFTAANTQIVNDCTWGTGAATVTCTGSHFVPGDVGKRVMGYIPATGQAPLTGCIADRITFTPMITGATAYTIATYVSGTQITVSQNPGGAAGGAAGCLIWGNPDDTNASTLETAYAAVTAYCPRVMLAAGGYWFSSPHFSTQPTGCAALTSLVGAPTTFGGVSLPQGFELEGRGPGSTMIYIGNDFPNGDSCNTFSGSSAHGGCFAIPLMGKWSDLGMSGGGQSTCQVANGKTLIVANVATIQNVTLENLCFVNTSASIVTGLEVDQLTQVRMFNSSGWGQNCINAVGPYAQGFQVVCENSPINNLTVQTNSGLYTFQCSGCLFLGAAQSPTGGNNVITIASGGSLSLFGTGISPSPVPGFSSTGTNLIQNNGGTLRADFLNEASAGSGTITGLSNTSTASVNYLANSQLSAVGTGATCTQNSFNQGTLYDVGGNIYNFAQGVGFQCLNIFGHGNGLTGKCTGVANANATLGLYGTGPNATVTTCTSTTIGSGFVMDQAHTLTGLQCTSTATTVSVACKAVINGTPNATLACTMTAATQCNGGGANVAVNKGDLVSAEIVTGAAETGSGIILTFIWE